MFKICGMTLRKFCVYFWCLMGWQTDKQTTGCSFILSILILSINPLMKECVLQVPQRATVSSSVLPGHRMWWINECDFFSFFNGGFYCLFFQLSHYSSSSLNGLLKQTDNMTNRQTYTVDSPKVIQTADLWKCLLSPLVCEFFSYKPNFKTCRAGKHVQTEQNINNSLLKEAMATSACS